eukprot:TRINITY_DN26715_c0_g1_i1.p1 TRINITY_DN26715_c0_g1~~TRINITY_DN26715_c0_g1_i1.p1  ORF type:complete len:311 (-),score=55.24 TRINITY_DN26715_c0_g1_i1:891-1823(-)
MCQNNALALRATAVLSGLVSILLVAGIARVVYVWVEWTPVFNEITCVKQKGHSFDIEQTETGGLVKTPAIKVIASPSFICSNPNPYGLTAWTPESVDIWVPAKIGDGKTKVGALYIPEFVLPRYGEGVLNMSFGAQALGKLAARMKLMPVDFIMDISLKAGGIIHLPMFGEDKNLTMSVQISCTLPVDVEKNEVGELQCTMPLIGARRLQSEQSGVIPQFLRRLGIRANFVITISATRKDLEGPTKILRVVMGLILAILIILLLPFLGLMIWSVRRLRELETKKKQVDSSDEEEDDDDYDDDEEDADDKE